MKKKKILITIILMFLVTPISKTSAMMEGRSISSLKNQEQEPNQKIFGEIKSKIDNFYNKYRDKLYVYGKEVRDIVNGILNKTDIEQGDYDDAIKGIEEIQKEIEKTRIEINEEKKKLEGEIEDKIKFEKDKTELKKYLKNIYNSLEEYKVRTSSVYVVSIFELCKVEIKKLILNGKLNNYVMNISIYFVIMAKK